MSARDAELLAKVSQVYVDLMRARDDAEVVRVIVAAVAPFGPDAVDLTYLHNGPDGVPVEMEIMCLSDRGELHAGHPLYGQCWPIHPGGIACRWVQSETEPQVIADVHAEPELEQMLQVLQRRPGSSVVLPLYSERHEGWQGVAALYWSQGHVPEDDELAFYRILLRMLSEAVAGTRTMRRLHATLRENQALLAETQRMLQETRVQRETLGVMLDNLPMGVEVLNVATNARELINRAGHEILGEGGQSERIDVTAGNVYYPGTSTQMRIEEHALTRVAATGEPARQEVEFARSADERVRLELTAARLTYPDDPVPRVILIYQDVTLTRRTEHERLRAQEELLRVQAAALAERSTPLIPLTDDVLVMPLIGTLDPERGQQVLEALVHLGGAQHVRAAILDITGVRGLDEAAAGMLISAARALRLRGVQPVLTGIQPAVAATLVELGVDLAGITIRGTLQDGVRWATRADRR